jgi:hypothetical protein
VGSSTGTTGLDGQAVCAFDLKKSMKVDRTRRDDHSVDCSIGDRAVVAAATVDAGKDKTLAWRKGRPRRLWVNGGRSGS